MIYHVLIAIHHIRGYDNISAYHEELRAWCTERYGESYDPSYRIGLAHAAPQFQWDSTIMATGEGMKLSFSFRDGEHAMMFKLTFA